MQPSGQWKLGEQCAERADAAADADDGGGAAVLEPTGNELLQRHSGDGKSCAHQKSAEEDPRHTGGAAENKTAKRRDKAAKCEDPADAEAVGENSKRELQEQIGIGRDGAQRSERGGGHCNLRGDRLAHHADGVAVEVGDQIGDRYQNNGIPLHEQQCPISL